MVKRFEQKYMENFLVEETPEKVMGFLAATMLSMALLFGVTLSNASFNSTETALPDPFSPAKVMSVIDNMAADYSSALISFTQPARDSLALYADQINWITEEAAAPLATALGFDGIDAGGSEAGAPRVAGAFKIAGSYESVSVDTLYALLINGF